MTDDWADHSTVTGGMSDLGLGDRTNNANMLNGGRAGQHQGWRFLCQRYSGSRAR